MAKLALPGFGVSVEGRRPTDFFSGLMCKRGHSLLRRRSIEPITPWQRNQPRTETVCTGRLGEQGSWTTAANRFILWRITATRC